jgi:hypothetical protein
MLVPIAKRGREEEIQMMSGLRKPRFYLFYQIFE